MRKAIPWLIALLILLLDRWSKFLILKHLRMGVEMIICPGLSITHVHNRGIAFSFFDSGGLGTRIFLHIVILAAVVVITWMLVRHGHNHLASGLSFGLILGGALGNLYDRIAYGWVVDFIRVWIHHKGRIYSWPDFNVADAAITTGAVLLILAEFFRRSPEADDAPDSD